MCKKNVETAEKIFRRISVRRASVKKCCCLKRQERDKDVQERESLHGLRRGGLSVSWRVRISHRWRDPWTQIQSSGAIPDGLKAADSAWRGASLGEDAQGPAWGRAVFPARNSRPPGSAELTVHFPGKLLRLSAGGKEPGRSWWGERGPVCERSRRCRPSRLRRTDGRMDRRSRPPGDGLPPSTMKQW